MVKSVHAVGAERGFTLIEVLIALAITSMVVSVLMSSVFYGAKVQSAIREELVEREQSLRTKDWFTNVLGACVPADGLSGSAFEGRPHEVVCETLAPLQGKKFLPSQRIRISLRQGTERTTQLVYAPAAVPTEEQVLMDIGDGSAEFAFLGVSGVEVPTWPVKPNDPETLPRRIVLKLKSRADPTSTEVWNVALLATPWLEPKGEALRPFGSERPF